MSLQRRLLLYLLLCAPLVWSLALWVSVDRARTEVNELFDSEMIRLARQVLATLGSVQPGMLAAESPQSNGGKNQDETDAEDMALAVWDARGSLALADREGVLLPYRPSTNGFIDQVIGDGKWRLYYLNSQAGDWQVVAGQKLYERDELIYSLTTSQIMPWLAMLPVLLLAMGWTVRRALEPVRQLTTQLRERDSGDLKPLSQDGTPADLKPLIDAMNGLFARIGEAVGRERRFTSDVAHELRTPLAVLRAQWDVLRRAASVAERTRAEAGFEAGLDRIHRVVTQMLALARLDSVMNLPQTTAVHWPGIVVQAMSDCLPIAERRHIELACEWPPEGIDAMPLTGDADLLTALLRNLLDNAVRYARPESTVTLRFGKDRMEVENDCQPLSPEERARLGERFHRPLGQPEGGSGLGISIVRRIAALHHLNVEFAPRANWEVFKVAVSAAAATRGSSRADQHQTGATSYLDRLDGRIRN